MIELKNIESKNIELKDIINSNTLVTQVIGNHKHLLTIPKLLIDHNKKVFVCTNSEHSLDLLVDCAKQLNVNAASNDHNLCHDVVYITTEFLEKKLLTHFLHNNPIIFTDYIIIDQLFTYNIHILAVLSYLLINSHIKVIILTNDSKKLDLKVPVNQINLSNNNQTTLIYQDHKRSSYDKIYDITVFKYKQPNNGDILIYATDDCEVDCLYSRLHLELPNAIILTERLRSMNHYLNVKTKKIIILTDFERLPVTFDNISIVIDTMKTKTKLSAELRRSSLINLGTCYRLISEDEFNRLPNGDEITNINNLILDFMKAKLNPFNIQYPINLELLERLKVISNNSLTDCGDFIRSIPLDLRNSVFLWRWIKAGHSLYPGIVIACILNSKNGGYFYIPRKKAETTPANYEDFCNEYIMTKFKNYLSNNTLSTYLKMWNDFTKSLDNLYFQLIENVNSINLNKWARDNSINHQQLFEAIELVSKIYNIVKKNIRNVDKNVVIFDVEEVVKYALPILTDIFGDCKITIKDGIMNAKGSKIRYMFDSRMIVNKNYNNCNIIPLVTHDIITRANLKIKYIDIFIIGDEISEIVESDNISDQINYLIKQYNLSKF
jgi:hypothetical protein